MILLTVDAGISLLLLSYLSVCSWVCRCIFMCGHIYVCTGVSDVWVDSFSCHHSDFTRLHFDTGSLTGLEIIKEGSVVWLDHEPQKLA